MSLTIFLHIKFPLTFEKTCLDRVRKSIDCVIVLFNANPVDDNKHFTILKVFIGDGLIIDNSFDLLHTIPKDDTHKTFLQQERQLFFEFTPMRRNKWREKRQRCPLFQIQGKIHH
ncbi:hypothetical protein D3C81_1537660 [compost metagenome]